MFGIVDVRYKSKKNVGVLRGKSMTVQNALKKSRKIISHLNKYEMKEVCPLNLKIVKLIGTIKLGDSVEYAQTTALPV